MCFTTCGPVRHSKNAPGLSVTQRWPWIALRAFGAWPLRDTSCNSPEATAELLGATAPSKSILIVPLTTRTHPEVRSTAYTRIAVGGHSCNTRLRCRIVSFDRGCWLQLCKERANASCGEV